MSANTGDSIFWSYYPEHEKIDTLTKKNLELPNHYFVSITPKEHPVHGDCWSIHFNKSGFKLLKENEQFSTGKEKDQKFYSYLQEFVEHSKKILDIDKIGTAWTHTPDSFLEENYNEQVHLSNMLKRIIAGQPVLY
jgi:hypothetical protein